MTIKTYSCAYANAWYSAGKYRIHFSDRCVSGQGSAYTSFNEKEQEAIESLKDFGKIIVLESVQKGFGEMKELTSKVGNLNRIFSNVKTRGSWGEVALQSLFEQILSPEQYKTQFRLNPRSQEAVDFVVVMPGQGGEED